MFFGPVVSYCICVDIVDGEAQIDLLLKRKESTYLLIYVFLMKGNDVTVL